MPLFDYVCSQCHETSELLIRSPDEALACPHCGSEQLQRLLGVPVAHSSGGSPSRSEPPTGPCGSACGCFPPG